MPADSQQIAKPTQIVDAFHDALIEIASRGDAVSYETRFRQLEPAIDNSHDFATIARLVGGHFWKNLSDKERTLFIEAFRRASIAAYASRFVSADGVNFEQAILDGSLGNRVTVSSYLRRANGDRAAFIYVLHDKHDRWQIITITVDGVSDLALQRAELTRIYSETGFQGVVDYLAAKAENAVEGN